VERLLRQDVALKTAAVHARVPVSLFQGQFDAVVSWTYNLGEGALKSSTMLKKINAVWHEAVPGQMKQWTRAGGKVLKGIERRREAEAALYQLRWYRSILEARCRFRTPPNDYLMSITTRHVRTFLTLVGHAADCMQRREPLAAQTTQCTLIVNR